MKNEYFKKGILFSVLLSVALTPGLIGCASSSPYDRPDEGKIQKDSDKTMQDLKQEEGRHGDDSGY